MDFSIDRYKLDTLRKPGNSTRPTIPYSQFPRPALPHISTSLEPASTTSGNVSTYPDSTSSVCPPSVDFSMDSATPSGQRRRRSSLLRSSEGRLRTQRQQQSRGHRAAKDSRDEQGSADEALSDSEELPLDNLSDEGLTDDEETGLTRPDKKRRTRRARRNTLLDQRIAAGIEITQEEKHEANQNLVKNMLINGLLIGLW